MRPLRFLWDTMISLTSTPTDAHTARLRRALSYAGFIVHSLPRGKERTKKTRPGVPPGNPLRLPLYKDKDEKNRYSYPVSLATEPTRAAGEESKSVLA